MAGRSPVAALCSAVLLAGCTGGSPPSPSSATSGTGAVTTVVDGLHAPWSIALHDGAALVSERDSGAVREVAEDGTRVIGTVEAAAARGEGGLLGIAVHEDFLYAYLTTEKDNRIMRFALSGADGALRLGAGEVLLEGIPAADVHNGGRIAFGPDGMLYATAGDAGTESTAQDLDSLSGKILRMTPEGQVPSDNPFDGSLVYSYGHRNPQGIAWDGDGTLYASEFGQNTWDELNVIEPGSNYGWPRVEGIGGGDEYVDPVQQWRPAEASPSGIAITDGAILIANLRGERLRTVPLDDLSTSSERFVGEYGRLRDVAVTPDGKLWVLTNTTDGRGDPAPQGDRILQVDPLP